MSFSISKRKSFFTDQNVFSFLILVFHPLHGDNEVVEMNTTALLALMMGRLLELSLAIESHKRN